MALSDALFTLFIGPLKTLFDIIYILLYKLTQNPGLSVIGLSLVMNFLLLPLYNQTDAIQLEAIETDKRLKPFVSHIKKTFKGNEQFMMLQTCYRQNHYKPTDAVKGISPLLLEIPFFMAAYNYLSEQALLQYAQFGPIADLAKPDGMLVFGTFSMNLLPILMTLINVFSTIIYTKDAPFKTKAQLYGMAALFLILLYDSPSGLVLYWTLNNLFSLIKNIFIRMKHPRKVLSILSSLTGFILLIYVLAFHELDSMKKYCFIAGLFCLLQLPLVLKKKKAQSAVPQNLRSGFFFSCTFLCILIGVLIPSAVIKASPAEFVDFTRINPLFYVLSTFLTAAGIFLIWLPVFFTISNNSGKQILYLGTWVFACVAVVDYMFFGADYGTLSPSLTYLETPVFGRAAFNTLLVLVIAAAAFLIFKKKIRFVGFICATLSLAIALMSCMNLIGIQKGYKETIAAMGSGNSSNGNDIIPLNKGGKNVMVLMMDRAIGAYIPYIMNEKPELLEKFSGFTYYPNTVSFGPNTNSGSPALFAGYEYTPEKINARSDESLESKHNEALKVMPVLFDSNGFEVTVCDPTYASYQWVSDLSIYDEYKNIASYHAIEHCTSARSGSHLLHRRAEKNRNFFFYSLMRVAPVPLHPVIYSDGTYSANQRELTAEDLQAQIDTDLGAFIGTQKRDGLLKASGIFDSFFEEYTVLDHLPKLTRIQDSDRNTFMMMSNETTHEPSLLQEPDYVPAPSVDNTQYEYEHGDRFVVNGRTMSMETEQQVMHYQVNMAALLKLGQWFDFLKENDVYDNTRIIIVADHGRGIRQFDDLIFGDEYYEDALRYMPLLMVKDFGSTEFTTDDTFMTNADVPTIAMNGLIENPLNPFSGMPINSDAKSQPVRILNTEWDTGINHGNVFLPGPWVSVHDNAWDINNWEVISTGE